MNRIAELAEFMGWEYGCVSADNLHDPYPKGECGGCCWKTGRLHKFKRVMGLREFNPFVSWDHTMLVEERVREKGLWEDYIEELLYLLLGTDEINLRNGFVSSEVHMLMAATKQQRMEAVLKVLDNLK